MLGITKVKDLKNGLEGLNQNASILVLVEEDLPLNGPGEIIDIQQQRVKLSRDRNGKPGISFDNDGENTVLITVTFDV